MISGETLANVFGSAPVGGCEFIPRVAQSAANAGFAVIPCGPGTKIPVCTLTARDLKLADTEAKGRGLPRHECGLKHAITDGDVARRVFTRLARRGDPNLAVVLGPSHHVVVDVDTADENRAFLRAWSSATGTDQTHRTPTVLSPGAVDASGEWVHKDGGHYWFRLPNGLEPPTDVNKLKLPGGWVLMWGSTYVLVPPSVRPEGPYRLAGQAEELPAWLGELLAGHQPASKPVRSRKTQPDVIDSWSCDRWDQVLTRDGWTLTVMTDNCGCPIWTAPGSHASPKSATAHREGCTKYDTSTGWGPLHIWTDNPPAYLLDCGKTLTPLQYEAASQHRGQIGQAMRSEGLKVDEPDDVLDMGAAPVAEVTPGKAQGTVTEGNAGGNGTYNLPPEFWGQRPELKHIHQAALHHMCSPDALLTVCLARLSAMVSHRTKLEIGLGPACLNLIVCPVGPSSAGKGLAMDAARRLLPSSDDGFRDGLGVGSGEGIPEAFMGVVMVGTGENYKTGDRKGEEKMAPQREQTRYNVLFQMDEGQSLGKMASRVGATIMPALRSLWSGATLGQANASSETTRCVPAGQYSAGVVLAFQPDTASAVLADTDGLAQRALWCPATSREVTAEVVDHPGVLGWSPDPLDSDTDVTLTFPLDIQMEYRVRRAGIVRGDVTEDPLDGHGQLVRAKVAALLCVLAGRTEPTREDWDLGDVVWQHSRSLRSALMNRAERVMLEETQKRTTARAIEAKVVAETLREQEREYDQRAVNRISRLVLARLESGPMTRSAVSRSLKSCDRKHLHDVVLSLKDAGKVAEADGTLALIP